MPPPSLSPGDAVAAVSPSMATADPNISMAVPSAGSSLAFWFQLDPVRTNT